MFAPRNFVLVVHNCATSVYIPKSAVILFFFFNDTATTEIYTLSLHDALPICWSCTTRWRARCAWPGRTSGGSRSEEHTSELQSLRHLVCRLLLEKKKKLIERADDDLEADADDLVLEEGDMYVLAPTSPHYAVC